MEAEGCDHGKLWTQQVVGSHVAPDPRCDSAALRPQAANTESWSRAAWLRGLGLRGSHTSLPVCGGVSKERGKNGSEDSGAGRQSGRGGVGRAKGRPPIGRLGGHNRDLLGLEVW